MDALLNLYSVTNVALSKRVCDQFLKITFFFAAKVFPGKVSLSDLQFDPKMTDKTSDEFKRASDKITAEVSGFIWGFMALHLTWIFNQMLPLLGIVDITIVFFSMYRWTKLLKVMLTTLKV